MPTWKPAADNDDDTIGFMGGVLNRAKKVLFADDIGEINNTKQQQQPKKSRARSRARLLASSNSSLVNITSSKSINNTKEKGVVKPRIDKENNNNKSMLSSQNLKSFTSMRSTNLKMDSLASSTTAATGPNNHQQPMSLSIGNKGLIAVNHRRNSREQSSNGGSLAANSSMIANNSKKKQPRQSAKVKRESNQRSEKLESSDKDELNVTTYSMADIDNSFTTTASTTGMIDIHKRKNNNRRKGGSRCNHPVSSMVQESSGVDKEETMSKGSKGKSTSTGGLSSLMALPASTQKTQKSTSDARSSRVVTKKAAQKKKKKKEKLTTSSLLNDVSSLTNCVESLMIEEEEKQPNQQQHNSMECSTPLTIRHRSMSGGITSPPINHRYTSITTNNSSLFPDRTPRPEINPNMKKKCDSKPTPDNFKDAALSTAKPMVMASPAPTLSTTTEMVISPILVGSGNEEETAIQAADTSFTSTVASPRILTTTPSFISSPTNEGDGSIVLCDAKSNLFSNVSKAEGTAKKSGVIAEQTARSPVRGSCVMEVELPTARKEDKVVVSRSRNIKKINLRTVVNKKENKPIAESGKAKELVIQPLVTTKEEEIAEPTRRSTRQSKPTDRLTVASWKNKKKKKNGERIVTFDSVERADEPIDDDDDDDHEEQFESPTFETIKVVKEQKGKTTRFKTENSIPKQAKAPLNPTTGDGEWTNDEISMLRDAQKNVNPTSTLYWQEVAVQVGTKSSSECQSKWQAMVATPKIVRRATKKKDTHTLNTSVSYDEEDDNDDDDEEDDLFNSSPYRQAEVEEDDIFASKAFSNSFGSSTGLSPCIKEGTTSIHEGEKPSALKFRRKGYNTYIDNLRKDINRVEKKKKNKPHKSNKTSNALNDTINDIRVQGENNISGNLLPDGTVKINIQEEEEQDAIDDDIWGNDQEEDEEDDIFS